MSRQCYNGNPINGYPFSRVGNDNFVENNNNSVDYMNVTRQDSTIITDNSSNNYSSYNGYNDLVSNNYMRRNTHQGSIGNNFFNQDQFNLAMNFTPQNVSGNSFFGAIDTNNLNAQNHNLTRDQLTSITVQLQNIVNQLLSNGN